MPYLTAKAIRRHQLQISCSSERIKKPGIEPSTPGLHIASDERACTTTTRRLLLQTVGNFLGYTGQYHTEPGIEIEWPYGKPKDTPECGFLGDLCYPTLGRFSYLSYLILNQMINGPVKRSPAI